VDISDVREHLRPYRSETGRPSIDPEAMIRMLLIGYYLGTPSERRLCDEVRLHLAYCRFCRLELDLAVRIIGQRHSDPNVRFPPIADIRPDPFSHGKANHDEVHSTRTGGPPLNLLRDA
jgi:hypothetical protein